MSEPMTPRTKAGADLIDFTAPAPTDAADPAEEWVANAHAFRNEVMFRIRDIEDEMLAKVAAAVGVAFIEAMRDMARTEALVIVEDRVLAAIEDIRKEASDGRP